MLHKHNEESVLVELKLSRYRHLHPPPPLPPPLFPSLLIFSSWWKDRHSSTIYSQFLISQPGMEVCTGTLENCDVLKSIALLKVLLCIRVDEIRTMLVIQFLVSL